MSAGPAAPSGRPRRTVVPIAATKEQPRPDVLGEPWAPVLHAMVRADIPFTLLDPKSSPGWPQDIPPTVLIARKDRRRATRLLAQYGWSRARRSRGAAWDDHNTITEAGLATLRLACEPGWTVDGHNVTLSGFTRWARLNARDHAGIPTAPPPWDGLPVAGTEETHVWNASEDTAVTKRVRRVRPVGPLRLQALKRALGWTFSNPHIRLHGVDGAGKTTVGDRLVERLGPNARRHHMGWRNWRTRAATRVLGDGPVKGFRKKLIMPFVLYWEMWIRFIQSARRDGVVVYDRHPYEFPLYGRGLWRLTMNLFFRALYPSTRITVYLTCSKKTSLDRKADLRDQDPQKRLAVKAAKDRHFRRKRNAWVFDTDEKEPDEIVETILARLPAPVAHHL